MINRQMKEWLDKVQLPVGERVLTGRLRESFLASPLGAKKDYSKQQFNNMLKEYAKDMGYGISQGASYMGKYFVFNSDKDVKSTHISMERLVHDTCGSFFDWAVAEKMVEYGERLSPKILMAKFVNEKLGGYLYYADNNGRTSLLTPQLFCKWLVRLNYYVNGRGPVEGRNGQGKWLVLI